MVGRRCRAASFTSPVGRERVPQAGEGMGWQRVADFETFRQVAEKGGAFFGQDTGQPMSHAGQDGIASALALEFAPPKGMPGKHGLGAVGEFVRERFRDRCPKIIARLVEDAPGRYSGQ